MHGTGTSLGDPIEVGALCAIIIDKSMHKVFGPQLQAEVIPKSSQVADHHYLKSLRKNALNLVVIH